MRIRLDKNTLTDYIEDLAVKCPNGGGRLRAISATIAAFWDFYSQLGADHLSAAFGALGQCTPGGEDPRLHARRATCQEISEMVDDAFYASPVNPDYERYSKIWRSLAASISPDETGRLGAIRDTHNREAAILEALHAAGGQPV